MNDRTTMLEIGDLRRVLDDSANQITFINTAIIAICERPNEMIGENEMMGLQSILFSVADKLRAADTCLSENLDLLEQASEAKQFKAQKAA